MTQNYSHLRSMPSLVAFNVPIWTDLKISQVKNTLNVVCYYLYKRGHTLKSLKPKKHALVMSTKCLKSKFVLSNEICKITKHIHNRNFVLYYTTVCFHTVLVVFLV